MPLLRRIHPGISATIVFCLLSVQQSAIWCTFASIPEFTRTYYGINNFELDFISSWGPIIYLGVMPCAGYALSYPRIVFHVARIGAILCTAATLIRAIPVLCSVDGVPDSGSVARVCMHICAILNAAVGPLSMGTVSKVAHQYVPPAYRTTAIGVIYAGQNIGPTIQGLIAPLLVQEASQVPKLLIAHLIMSLTVLCITLLLMPRPQRNSETRQLLTSSPIQLQPSYRSVVRIPSFGLLAVSGAIAAGVGSGQSVLLTQILTMNAPGFIKFNDISAGQVNFAMGIAIILGNIFGGMLGDAFFSQRYRLLGFISKFISFFCTGVLASFTPMSVGKSPLIRGMPHAVVSAACVGFGFCDGMCDPVNFQLGVTTTFPAPPEMSAALLTYGYNIATLAVLFVVPSNACLVNWPMALVNLASCVAYILLKERRLDTCSAPEECEQPIS